MLQNQFCIVGINTNLQYVNIYTVYMIKIYFATKMTN